MIKVSDEIVDKLSKYYNHPFTQQRLPWVKETPFHIWVDRELRRIYGDDFTLA